MLRFENASLFEVTLLWGALALPSLWLAWRYLSVLDPLRRLLAVVLRLSLLMALCLLLGGAQCEQEARDVELIVLRDVSESTQFVPVPNDSNLREQVDAFVDRVREQDEARQPDDRVGLVMFGRRAVVESVPSASPRSSGASSVDPGGTDAAGAVQLGLALSSPRSLRRMLMIWDGNQTSGDLDAALDLAASQGIPIDVLPLRYQVRNEVIVERIVAPSWRREGEPFDIEVVINSTNSRDVTGSLSLLRQEQLLDLDDRQQGVQGARRVTLRPGRNVERFRVPASMAGGVMQFRSVFQADASAQASDAILANNTATGFTVVRGQGRVLYVDSDDGRRGQYLIPALAREGIRIDSDRLSVDQFPSSLVELQDYDAVILQNIPRGSGGLSEQQQAMLASYVHDQGGGLLMIGGERALGAGGWQGSRLEEVLPVEMEVPARRELPRGAVMLVLDRSGSMSDGFGPMNKLEASIVASVKAVESLSGRDLVGVVAFDSGAETILPLADNNKTRTVAALKGIDIGGGTDISSGLREGYPPLLNAASGFKHLILMTDGHSDPTGCLELAAQGFAAGVSLSTIGVGDGHDAAFLQGLAAAGGGRYHPVTNPAELSMAFLREASVVRRSLILENKDGIDVARTTASSELLGTSDFAAPPVFGLVLTSPKQNPRVEIPLVAGGSRDPLLAFWQSGLGRSAVFASDAYNRWLSGWVGNANFDRFWAQLVRSVARPAESGDFDVRIETRGDRARIVVEALDADDRYRAFLDIAGNVVMPDMSVREVRLAQTSPGTYEAEFDAREAGNYIAGLAWRGPGGARGVIRTGTVVNSSPELRDLRSNDSRLAEVAQRTGGRVLPPFDPSVSLFTRDGLRPVSSPTPLREALLVASLGLLMLDIANRRIAWDRSALRRQQRLQVARPTSSVQALRQAKTRALDTVREAAADDAIPPPAATMTVPTQTTERRSTDVAPEEPPEPTSKPEPDDRLGGLLEAKRRARERMKKREGK
jgi:uncharacterized membrane protein